MAATSDARLVLMTGFPGFLGKLLLLRLARQNPADRYLLLVEDRFRERAEGSLARLAREDLPGLDGRCELLTGDISRTLLGLEPERYAELARTLAQVWHLAAIYDLAVPPDLAHRVNVVGTTNVLDLCEQCTGLQFMGYVSTCYVSGRRRGVILESELDCGQTFKNHYESTKFWAELEVQRRTKVPSIIFRPGIVVGDSRTGITDKYDGPYFVLRLLQHLPAFLPVPNVGRGDAVVNIIPSDFAVEAMAEIARQPEAVGKVFQLADPRSLRSREIMALMLSVAGKGRVVGAVPARLVEGLVGLAPVSRFLRLPREVLEYFNHEAIYDSSNTQQFLAASGLRCPALADYLPVLYRFMREHEDPLAR